MQGLSWYGGGEEVGQDHGSWDEYDDDAHVDGGGDDGEGSCVDVVDDVVGDDGDEEVEVGELGHVVGAYCWCSQGGSVCSFSLLGGFSRGISAGTYRWTPYHKPHS